jgi:hypothetical protein
MRAQGEQPGRSRTRPAKPRCLPYPHNSVIIASQLSCSHVRCTVAPGYHTSGLRYGLYDLRAGAQVPGGQAVSCPGARPRVRGRRLRLPWLSARPRGSPSLPLSL